MAKFWPWNLRLVAFSLSPYLLQQRLKFNEEYSWVP